MLNINGEFLEEVKPAFKKQVKALLKEACAKVAEAEKLLAEAEKLSSVINTEDSLKSSIQTAVFNRNYKFLKRCQIDLTEGVTECLPVEGQSETPETPVNLVSGEPVSKKRKSQKKATGTRKYRGRRKKVKYKGVTFISGNAEGNQYCARFAFKGLASILGTFSTDLEAAYAYDEFKYSKTKSIKGLNFPGRIESRLRKKTIDE